MSSHETRGSACGHTFTIEEADNQYILNVPSLRFLGVFLSLPSAFAAARLLAEQEAWPPRMDHPSPKRTAETARFAEDRRKPAPLAAAL